MITGTPAAGDYFAILAHFDAELAWSLSVVALTECLTVEPLCRPCMPSV